MQFLLLHIRKNINNHPSSTLAFFTPNWITTLHNQNCKEQSHPLTPSRANNFLQVQRWRHRASTTSGGGLNWLNVKVGPWRPVAVSRRRRRRLKLVWGRDYRYCGKSLQARDRRETCVRFSVDREGRVGDGVFVSWGWWWEEQEVKFRNISWGKCEKNIFYLRI